MDLNNIMFWFKQLLRPRALSAYQKIIKRDAFSKADLAAINWRKRKAIVAYAYQHIPYYKRYYDEANFHPTMLVSEKDWEKVPILEKSDIRQYKEQLKNPNLPASRFRPITTGGSTGEPLQLYRDRDIDEEILKWRMLRRWGISPAANKAMFWRIPQVDTSVKAKLKNELLWWPTRRIKIDASLLGEKELEACLQKIIQVKPSVIWGYVGAVEQFALFLKRKKQYLSFIKLSWVTAAPVTQLQKKLFASVFGGSLLDQYACSEIHWVASNCPTSENLHVESDFRQLDILDSDNKLAPIGQLGDIALTDLENRVFPLIKYRLGDQSKLISGSCSCGLNFPVIAPIKGRITEAVVVPDKGVLNGEFLTTIFDDYHQYIEKFQIHQLADYSLQIKVVIHQPDKNIKDILDQVKHILHEKTDHQLAIDTLVVDDIPADRGKIRFVKSDVNL